MKPLTKSGDETRTDLAYIRTGLASWGMAMLLSQQPHKSEVWIVFLALGIISVWRARASIF